MRTKLSLALLASLPLGAQGIAITPPVFDFTVGTPYTGAFTATPAGPAYTWTMLTSSPPYGSWGLASDGTLTATPQGCYDFWANSQPCPNPLQPMTGTLAVQVTDGTNTAQQTYAISADWNPSQASYLGDQTRYFSMMAASAGLLVPPIAAGGHLVIANPIFRDSRYDNLPAWNAWIDAMKAAGMSIVNIEVDLECLLSARTSCLNLYTGAMAHARSLGMTVSINPAFYTAQSCGDPGCPTPESQVPPAPANGMADACMAALGNHPINWTTITVGGNAYGSGVADWYTCLVTYSISGLGNVSAYRYMLQNWLHSGDRFVPVHEPTTQAAQWSEGIKDLLTTGCSASQDPVPVHSQSCSGQIIAGSSLHNTCPDDWLVNFLQLFFSEVSGWAVPSGIQYGVAINSREMATSYGYASAFAGLTGSVSMGLDMYDFDEGRQSLYTSTIAAFSGHSVFVEEFGPEAWTNATGPRGEACAIVGLQSCTWNTRNQNFFASLLSFLASQGVTDASLYGTEILGACAPVYPDNGQNNDVLNAVTTAMENHQYSLASSRMAAILSQWNMTGLAGGTLAGVSLIP